MAGWILIVALASCQTRAEKTWEIDGAHMTVLHSRPDRFLVTTLDERGLPAIACHAWATGERKWIYAWDSKFFAHQHLRPSHCSWVGDRVAIVGRRLIVLLNGETGQPLLEEKMDDVPRGGGLSGVLTDGGLHVVMPGEARLYELSGKLRWKLSAGTRNVAPYGGAKKVDTPNAILKQHVAGDATLLTVGIFDNIRDENKTSETPTLYWRVGHASGSKSDFLKGMEYGKITAEGDFVVSSVDPHAFTVHSIETGKSLTKMGLPEVGKSRDGKPTYRWLIAESIDGRLVHEAGGKHYIAFGEGWRHTGPDFSRILEIESGRVTLDEETETWKAMAVADGALIWAGTSKLRATNLKNGNVRWEHELGAGPPDRVEIAGRNAIYIRAKEPENYLNNRNVLRVASLKDGALVKEVEIPGTYTRDYQILPGGKRWAVPNRSHLFDPEGLTIESISGIPNLPNMGFGPYSGDGRRFITITERKQWMGFEFRPEPTKDP